MYNINFDTLTQLLLPPRLRQSRMVAWVRLLLAGIESIYNRWVSHINVIDDQLRYNGQVAYLRRAITNKVIACDIMDSYDPPWQLYIYRISDNSSDWVYLFNASQQNSPLHTFVWLHNTIDYRLEADYTIALQTIDIDSYVVRVSEIANSYNIASKRFRIIQLFE